MIVVPIVLAVIGLPIVALLQRAPNPNRTPPRGWREPEPVIMLDALEDAPGADSKRPKRDVCVRRGRA
jgi:hypothetical protein